MSEIKLISPLLDNIDMGEPISDRCGVRACPAMNRDSGAKYIVKIVSSPATESQLDALLLSGAYSSKEAAVSYFKELAEGIISEAQTLQKLSALEGFVGFDGWQIEPMDNEAGYDVYLKAAYRKTLDRVLNGSSMTHLGALNLGLDLCSALSVCRRCGYIYAALKPSNIYMVSDNSFKIGDIGFMRLDSLKYASLPERCRSRYTAPEIQDAYSAVNTTVDIYALGMILYQVFNGGQLPTATDGELPPPDYADYEIAEIIMKACALDPSQRWQDPMDMGQALIGYMQRNGVHDTPIIPQATPTLDGDEDTSAEADPIDEEANDETLISETEADAADENETDETDTAEGETAVAAEEPENQDTAETPEPVADPVAEESEASDTSESAEEIEEDSGATATPIVADTEDADNTPVSAVEEPDTQVTDEVAEAAETTDVDDTAEASDISDDADATDAVTAEENPESPESAETADSGELDTVSEEDELENLSFLTDTQEDETLPSDDIVNNDDVQISAEVTDILNQADELIAHPTPDPVVQPEAIDVQIPAPVEPEDLNSAPSADAEEAMNVDENGDAEGSTNEDAETAEDADEETEYYEDKPKSHWLRNTLLAILALAVIAAGYFFYKYFYLQTIDAFSISGGDDSLTVSITTDTNEELLSIICTDTYGNKQTKTPVNGMATFTELAPNTTYSVRIEIDGFHKLVGESTGAYATPKRTNIAQFQALTGSEDGSVILSFTVEGRDCEEWKLKYSADGEPECEVAFSGHIYSLTGLVIGKEYTFELTPAIDIAFTGTNTLTHTASKLVRASDLTITSCFNKRLEAIWKAPTDTEVASWTVHCYNENGYDQTIVTEECYAAFDGITDTDSYTIEVTADTMSVGERAFVSENSVTVSNFSVKHYDNTGIALTWGINNVTADVAWKLQYSIDGAAVQEIIIDDTTPPKITPYIPGAQYVITLLTQNNDAVLGGNLEFTADLPVMFNSFGVHKDDMYFNMCRYPGYEGWNRYDLYDSDYTTTFTSGESASFLVRIGGEYGISSETLEVMYVIHSQDGTLISSAIQSNTWSSWWYRNYGEFDIPSLPSTPGEYKIDVYFNGALAGQETFTITE